MRQTDKGRELSREEMAAYQVADTLLHADNEVVRTYRDLDKAESNLHEKGLAFGRALIAFREEYKRKGKGWLEKLHSFGVSEAKAYYWIREVEGKPNNRHRRYWDDREFCVTQNSSTTTESVDTPPNTDKGSEPNEGSSRIGPSHSDAICEIKLLLLANQKKVFLSAAKKLVGFGNSTNYHQAVFQAVVYVAAEREKQTLLDVLEPCKRVQFTQEEPIPDLGEALGLTTKEPTGSEVAQ